MITGGWEAEVAANPEAPPAFEQPIAVGAYGTARGGSYGARGVGGRFRWEPDAPVALELYLEVETVDWSGGPRLDLPNGFRIYRPIAWGPVRVKPGFGFCDIVSLVGPTQPDGPRADDVLLGVHADLGAEVAFSRSWSLFLDGQADVYAGHDRKSGGWTGDVGESLRPFATAQVNLGVQVHVADLR